MLKRIFSFALLFTIYFSTPIETFAASLFDNPLENQLTIIQNQFEAIISNVDTAEYAVTKENVKLKKNKAEVAQELANIKETLDVLKENHLHIADHKTIVIYSFLIKDLISYFTSLLTNENIHNSSSEKFDEMIHTKLKDLNSIEIDNETFNNSLETIKKNQNKINPLTKQTETLGLSKKNLNFRKFEKSKTWERIKIGTKYSIIAAMSLTGLAIVTHPQTKIPFTKNFTVGDLPFPIAQGMNHPIWGSYIAQEFQINALKNPGTTPTKLQTIPFFSGLTSGLTKIIPFSLTLSQLFKPVTTFVSKISDSAFGLLDTESDYKNMAEWTNEKIANFLATQCRGTLNGASSDSNNMLNSDITFDDIIGEDDFKETAEKVAHLILNPVLYERANVQPKYGFLFYGPSQTGKSALAIAFKNFLSSKQEDNKKVHFMQVTLSALNLLGVERIFDIAEQQAPCVLYFDEIDRLVPKGSALEGAFQTCVAENIKNNVFVIGTTNKEPKDFSPAMVENGRLGSHYAFTYPDYIKRFQSIKRELAKKKIKLNNMDAIINKMARQSGNKNTYNHLNSVVTDAYIEAKKHNRRVNELDLQKAFDEQIRHMLPSSNKDSKMVGIYQVGIAVFRHLKKTERKINCLTTRDVQKVIFQQEYNYTPPQKQSDKPNFTGYAFTSGPNSTSIKSSNTAQINETIALLAGQAALKLSLLNDEFDNYMPEHQELYYNKIKYKFSTDGKITDKIRAQIADQQAKDKKAVQEILKPYTEQINLLSDYLNLKETIREEEWEGLMKEIDKGLKTLTSKTESNKKLAASLLENLCKTNKWNLLEEIGQNPTEVKLLSELQQFDMAQSLLEKNLINQPPSMLKALHQYLNHEKEEAEEQKTD